MAYRKFHNLRNGIDAVLCILRHGLDPGVYATGEGWRCKRCHALRMKHHGGATINTGTTVKTASIAEVFGVDTSKGPRP